jgi:tryptophan synthase beta chain
MNAQTIREEGVLERILARRRRDVAARRALVPRAALEARLVPSDRDFHAALTRPGIALIAEVKERSPSRGPLRAAYDPVALAAQYEGRAHAVSVLTEGAHFGGSLGDLARVRRATRAPLLQKDFVVDVDYQIPEARALGADAVLLLARVLRDAEIERGLTLARELGMEALVEVHDDAELDRVLGATSARIVGINARDLDRLGLDPARVLRLAARIRHEGRCVVAESGLTRRAELRALEGLADAVLVGTGILTADDVPARLAELGFPKRSARPEVKLCGLRTPAHAALASRLGVAWAGINRVEGARRSVDRARAIDLVAQLDGPRAVGVYRDRDADFVLADARAIGLDAVQLHGDEPPETTRALVAAGLTVFKAIAVPRALDTLHAHVDAGARILLDASEGGSGRAFDPAALSRILMPRPLGLAGGLRADTVQAAMAALEPEFVDVASGIEVDGEPDAARAEAFVRAVHGEPARLAPRFGAFGGRYVSELLVPGLAEIERAFAEAQADPLFRAELSALLREFAGRPTPLTFAATLSREVGARVFLKREDLLHGGAHKTSNTLGQGLLAKRLGKRRLIAETGAGQHGVATAMIGAKLGLAVDIFMGAHDVARQRPNVQRMELFGARVHPVTSGSATLKDAINEALREWSATIEDTFYVFGTAAGPHPFPRIVRELQRIIGDEVRAELLVREGRLPDHVYACVGGGSNAIGSFAAFLDDPGVELVGVEAGGEGLAGRHGATLTAGRPGVLHGAHSYVLQDAHGQIVEAHSVSAGLDYPGVGPEHAHLKEIGRARYVIATDDEAVAAVGWLARHEAILPALETAHAVAALLREGRAGRFAPGALVVLNVSGRGDKDLDHLARIAAGSAS